MKHITIVLMALALAACATSNSPSSGANTAATPTVEKEYRTGSRIPVRDPSAASASPTTTAQPSMLPGPKVQ
jgi:hypothetical protein